MTPELPDFDLNAAMASLYASGDYRGHICLWRHDGTLVRRLETMCERVATLELHQSTGCQVGVRAPEGPEEVDRERVVGHFVLLLSRGPKRAGPVGS